MAAKADLQEWVIHALKDHGGAARLAGIAEHSWNDHANGLRASGDLFFTWQYDMRWQAQNQQKAGKLKKLSRSWRLS